MYLLDYASEVEITNCSNCQLFIGPVDGPAIFDSCHNCNVAVSSQQFQAKSCGSCAFGLYCATSPSLSNCSDIKISCWSGAYAGLSAHFAAANLDPTKNQWNKVYDGSAGTVEPNFVIIETAAEPWEVTVIEGTPENPVPAPSAAAAAPAAAVMMEELAAPVEDEVIAAAVEPLMENGTANNNSHAQPIVVDTPATAVARDALQERLASQAREEAEKKAAAQAAASQFLAEFYEERNASRDKRIAAGRDELARRSSGEAGPEGESVWEKAISMIDFNAARPGGTDLSRFKSVLIRCKERA